MDENIWSIDPWKRRVFKASLKENKGSKFKQNDCETCDCDTWEHFKKSRFKISLP